MKTFYDCNLFLIYVKFPIFEKLLWLPFISRIYFFHAQAHVLGVDNDETFAATFFAPDTPPQDGSQTDTNGDSVHDKPTKWPKPWETGTIATVIGVLPAGCRTAPDPFAHCAFRTAELPTVDSSVGEFPCRSADVYEIHTKMWKVKY